MKTATLVAAVREQIGTWRQQGNRVVFVPTMGNLHAGHVSLLEAAKQHGDRFVASIFVNPMQFGPNEDFNHYPRTPQRDTDMLAAAGCDLMFMPDVAEMYPQGEAHAARVEVPGISDVLCGEFRPGHFQGVATVVAKLFNIVAPDVAVFGAKDFQQLVVIRRMTADLCLPVEIVGAPTVRETDGLAMSSRNQYLTASERLIAPAVYRELTRAHELVLAGERDFGRVGAAGAAALTRLGFTVDYFCVRDRATLALPAADTRELVVLTAARLSRARLIDNIQFDV